MTFSGGCSRSIGPSRGRRWRSLLGCQPEVSSVFCGISCRLCIEYASITGEVQLARHTCKAGEHHGQRDKPGGGLDTKRYENVRKCCPSIESKMDFSKSSSVCQELLSHKKLTKEAARSCDWPMNRFSLDCRSADGYLSTELSDSVRWGWHQKRMDSLKMGEFLISSFRSGARDTDGGLLLLLWCCQVQREKHWTHFKTQSRVLD